MRAAAFALLLTIFCAYAQGLRCYTCKFDDPICIDPKSSKFKDFSKECGDDGTYKCVVYREGTRGCKKVNNVDNVDKSPLCDKGFDEKKRGCHCLEDNCNNRELFYCSYCDSFDDLACPRYNFTQICSEKEKACKTRYEVNQFDNYYRPKTVTFRGCAEVEKKVESCSVSSDKLECWCKEKNCNKPEKADPHCHDCEGEGCQNVQKPPFFAMKCGNDVAQTCIIKVTKSEKGSELFRGCVPYSFEKGVEPYPIASESSWPPCEGWSYNRKEAKEIEGCQCYSEHCNNNKITLPGPQCAVCENNKDCTKTAADQKLDVCELKEVCYSSYVSKMQDDGTFLPGKIDKRGCILRSEIKNNYKINNCYISSSPNEEAGGEMNCYCDSDDCNKRKDDFKCHECQNCPSVSNPRDNNEKISCKDQVASACVIQVKNDNGQSIVNRKCQSFFLNETSTPQKCDEWNWKLGQEGECWCFGDRCNDKSFVERITTTTMPTMTCYTQDFCYTKPLKEESTQHRPCGIMDAFQTTECSAHDGCVYFLKVDTESGDVFESRVCGNDYSIDDCKVISDGKYSTGICPCATSKCNRRGDDEKRIEELGKINAAFMPKVEKANSCKNLKSVNLILAGLVILYIFK